MLIVNQKKDTTINFANVMYLDINAYEQSIEIVAMLTNGTPLTIGSYSTMQKAASVIKQFQSAYFRYASRGSVSITPPTVNTVVYQMPEDSEVMEE